MTKYEKLIDELSNMAFENADANKKKKENDALKFELRRPLFHLMQTN